MKFFKFLFFVLFFAMLSFYNKWQLCHSTKPLFAFSSLSRCIRKENIGNKSLHAVYFCIANVLLDDSNTCSPKKECHMHEFLHREKENAEKKDSIFLSARSLTTLGENESTVFPLLSKADLVFTSVLFDSNLCCIIVNYHVFSIFYFFAKVEDNCKKFTKKHIVFTKSEILYNLYPKVNVINESRIITHDLYHKFLNDSNSEIFFYVLERCSSCNELFNISNIVFSNLRHCPNHKYFQMYNHFKCGRTKRFRQEKKRSAINSANCNKQVNCEAIHSKNLNNKSLKHKHFNDADSKLYSLIDSNNINFNSQNSNIHYNCRHEIHNSFKKKNQKLSILGKIADSSNLPLLDTKYLASYGIVIIVSTYIFFLLFMYMIVFSKFMPDTGNFILDSIKGDEYYCLLFVYIVPTTFLFVYWNWLSINFYKHA